MSHPRIQKSHRRRAVVAVQVAVLMAVLIGFAALSIDVGAMYNVRNDLQRAADASALAAAAKLSDYGTGDPLGLAREAALDMTQRNPAFGKELSIDPQTDVVFGRAVLDEQTGKYDFVPTENLPDAVRVTVQMSEGSVNGAMPLYFAHIFGKGSTNISARATAMMVPRDIAIVSDLSASHTDDSELYHYKDTEINLWDVWDKWPGGYDDYPDSVWLPGEIKSGWNEGGQFPQAAGPAWGFFKELGYGTMELPSSYDPASDAGLVKLEYNKNWSNSTLRTWLTNRGYSTAEVDAMFAKNSDGSGAWPYRTAAALGFAYWNSGIPGGLWETRGVPGGNGNTTVGSNELEWVTQVNNRSTNDSRALFLDYISYYMKSTGTGMYQANSKFRYRFGAKTFFDYMMVEHPSNAETPEFSSTPTQPMQAVKDAVEHMVNYVIEMETDDQLSLEIYGTTARHEVDMTLDIHQVRDRLLEMQAGHYDSWTNMGGGLERAIEELTSSRVRSASKKMIILLTDGYANVTRSGQTGNYSGGAQYALEEAQDAADLGFRIFAVSVGSDCNIDLMDEIADIGYGEHFHAEGSIDEYSEQLEEIFEKLGGKRPVELIE